MRPPDRFIGGEESALANSSTRDSPYRSSVPTRARHFALEDAPPWSTTPKRWPTLRSSRGMDLDRFEPGGRPDEPGTCLVTISGDVAHPGVVEVDRGTPLSDIAALGRPVDPAQALLVGGYGGSWVGPAHFGIPYSSLSLRTIGASAGVGVIVVLGERVWSRRVGSDRPLPGRPERWAVRPLRLWTPRHRRRTGSTRSGPSRR